VTRADVAAWDGFAAALATASAALAGLVFVAVSINITRILSVRNLPGRAGETVILFVGALCECALVLIPDQPVTALGVELLVAGTLAAAILGAIVVPALGVPMPTRQLQPASWRLARVITWLIATVPVILAGCSLIGWIPGGLFWFAGGILLAVVVAAGNAWVLLVEVVRDERYRPLGEPPGTEAPDLPADGTS
jgi:modulator of FtsH protease